MIGINEIYTSFEGEGIDCGTPTVFVRFQGCNIGCKWCDTLQARSFDPSLMKNKEGCEKYRAYDNFFEVAYSIYEQLKENPGVSRISFTGGDPVNKLRDIINIIDVLSVAYKLDATYTQYLPTYHLEHPGFFTNHDEYHTFKDAYKPMLYKFDSICFDYKTVSSGVKYDREMSLYTFFQFLFYANTNSKKYSLKAVIGDEKDLLDFCHTFFKVWDKLNAKYQQSIKDNAVILLSPLWSSEKKVSSTSFILPTLNEYSLRFPFPVRISTQIHKILGFA